MKLSPKGIIRRLSLDQSIYDIQGTHNVCQTSSGTICNPVWVYTHAY